LAHRKLRDSEKALRSRAGGDAVSITQPEQPQRPVEKPPKGEWHAVLPFFDLKASYVVQILLTSALLLVGILQLGVYTQQARIMRDQTNLSSAQTLISNAQVAVSNRQADIMDSQTKILANQLTFSQTLERAWIKADLIFDGDLQYVKGIGKTFPFHLQLTNVGHTPAYNVRSIAFLYTPVTSTEDIFGT
jgi:hypothetical protein